MSGLIVHSVERRAKYILLGTSSGTAPGPEPCDIRPFTARYIRITGHGNTAAEKLDQCAGL